MNLKRLLLLLVLCGNIVHGVNAQTNCADLIYVSTAGNPIGSGTIGDPVTLDRALQLVTPTRHHVKLLNGIYNYAQKFVIPSNTVLDGRYEIIGGEWIKNSALTTVLNVAAPFETASGVGHYIALQLNGVTEVYIKDITLNNTTNASGTTSSKGRTVYGIHVSNTTNFYFTRLNITVGNGSAGAAGANGANGTAGANGGTGHTGDIDGVSCNNGNTGTGGNGGGGGGAGGFGSSTCNGTTPGSIGGAGGTLRAGGGGGGGGSGGHENEPNIDGRIGGRGGNGGGGAAFGNGGGGGNGSSSSCSIANGAGGQGGSNGAAGANASAAAPAPTFAQFFIPGNQAAQGSDGAGGGGAGGGGGGSGQADDNSGAFGCIVDDGGGSGGGGGGGGGQGGQGGFGGFGGGGSFGVYAETGNSGAFLRDLAISVGSVGSGGIRGSGGTGGNGGNGGGNGGGCSGGETGCGGSGGTGGRGGDGGLGQNGANGVANTVRGQTLTGTSVPNPRTITAAMYGGCTNSEVIITKNAGTWTLQPSASYINDLTAASSSYNNASNTAILTYSSIGHKDLVVDGVNYRNFIYIRDTRALPTFAGSMQSIVCEGDAFTMSTPTSGLQYEWVIFDAAATTASPVAIFTTSVASWTTPVTGVSTNYSVRLRTKDACCGWSAPVYFPFTVAATSAGPSATGATICVGQTATLTATGTGLGNLSWYSDPLGQIVLQSTPGAASSFVTPILTQSTVFYVGEGVGSCVGTLTAVQATVAPTPAPPSGSSSPVCQGSNVILNGFGAGGTLSWFAAPTGGVALGSGATYNAGALVAGAYTFYISENNGTCTSTRNAVGAVVNPPPAAPTASGTTICENTSTTLTASGTGTMEWYADAAMTNLLSTGSSFNTPVLSATTTYHVAQTSAVGCRSTTATAVTVTVSPNPAAPAGTGATICEGQTATLTAVGAGGTLDWYGDASGSVVLGSGASFTTGALTQSTTFYVGETSAAGCPGALSAVVATVNPLPAAPAGSSAPVCEGADVMLNGFGSGGTLSWFNVPSGGAALGTGAAFNAGPLAAGSYTFYVSENDGSCSSGRTPVAATVNPNPAAPTALGTAICENTSITLSASGSGTIEWFADAGMTNLLTTGSSYTTPILSATTDYFVSQSNASGCLSPATTVTVTVNPSPAAPAGTGATICAGQTATLTAVGAGGTLNWYGDASGSVVLGSGAGFTTGALTQSTTYYVGETSAAGCESALSAVVATVNPLPVAPAGSSAPVCEGADLILNGAGSGGTLSWFNVPSGGVALGTGSPFNAGPLAAGSYTFYVSENDGTCASGRTPVAATVNTVPAAPTASGTTACSGNAVNLSASGTGSIQWYADAGLTNLLAVGSNYTTASLATTTDYFVVQVNANGCRSLATTVTVTINPVPANPVGTNATICAGQSAALTATGGAGVLSWYADGTGSMLLAVGGTYNTAILAQSTTYYVQEVSAGGCASAFVPVTALVNPTPVAPTASAAPVCEGNDVIFNGSGAGGTLSWFNVPSGGVALSTGGSYNAGPLTAGSYTYYVSEDNGACSSSRTAVTATVNTVPAAPTASNASTCSGNTVVLTASGTGTIQWYADAGLTNMLAVGSSYTTPALTTTTDYYAVQVNASGCRSLATMVTVTVSATPNTPAAAAISTCTGATITLSATGSGAGDIVFYNSAGVEIGRGTMSVGNPTITFSLGTLPAGTYNYYTAEDGGSGCISAQASIVVTVLAAPTAPTVMNDGPACEGDDIFLQASTIQGATYYWTGPNGFNTSLQSVLLPAVSAAQAGTYTVTAMVNGCNSTSATTTVTVSTVPVITGGISNNGPLCEGDDLVLTAPNIAGVNYQWTGPNGFSGNQAITGIIGVNEPDHQGFYTLIVTDNTNGCESVPLSTLVEINRLPQPGMAFSNSPLCAGSTIELSVPEVFGAAYSWTGPNGFTSNSRTPQIPNASAVTAGTYTVVVSINNCSALLDVDVIIDTVPNTDIIADTTILEGDELVLYATGGILYQWSPGTYLNTPSSPTPVFSGAPVGTYTYSVNIQDATGCGAIQKVTVTVEPRNDIIITDLYTPNGDGVNDTWVIDFLQNVEPYTLQVFSRGGLQVYYSENYANDWDGTHYKNGKRLPDGTYYYLIQTQARNYTGAVTIKR